MKINDYINTKIRDAYLKKSQSKRLEDKNKSQNTLKLQTRKKDELVLSARTADVRKFQEMAKDISDIRQDKIKSVKSQVDSGQYRVDSKLVVDSINNILTPE